MDKLNRLKTTRIQTNLHFPFFQLITTSSLYREEAHQHQAATETAELPQQDFRPIERDDGYEEVRSYRCEEEDIPDKPLDLMVRSSDFSRYILSTHLSDAEMTDIVRRALHCLINNLYHWTIKWRRGVRYRVGNGLLVHGKEGPYESFNKKAWGIPAEEVFSVKQMREAKKILLRHGLIFQWKRAASSFGRAALYRPTEEFLAAVDSFRSAPSEQVKSPSLRQVDDEEDLPFSSGEVALYGPKQGKKRGPRIDWVGGQGALYQEQLDNFNEHIGKFEYSIEFDTITAEYCSYNDLGREISQGKVQIDRRHLELGRVFGDGRWDRGGRFYHSLIQDIRPCHRHLIRIDGQEVEHLDFSSQHLTFAYHLSGLELPEATYSVEGTTLPRPLVKAVALTLVNFDTEGRKPNWQLIANAIFGYRKGNRFIDKVHGKRERRFQEYLSYHYMRGDTAEVELWGKKLAQLWALEISHNGIDPYHELKRVAQLLMAKHEPVAAYLLHGKGLEFQHLDSQIAAGIMERCISTNTPIIPIHDGFITVRSRAEWLEQVMKEEHQKVLGVTMEPKVGRGF